MANRKREVYKPKPMTEGKRNLIQGLLQEYNIQSADDIQEALKDLLSGTIQDMLETEMDNHLGYDRYERSGEPNYRNGTKPKTVRSKYGEFEVNVPQDRQSSFEPQVLPKRQKDISSIDDKIIFMYAKGMTTRQISEAIEDIYGFEVSEGMVSDITDKLLPRIEEWQNRPLSSVYPIVFIDAVHFSVRDDGVIRKLATYVVLGINEDGMKEVLSIVVGENESSKYWLSVLNSLKNRGVQDILILCSDGLTGIKDAISAAFPETEQQRCIVHMVRNTLKYVANKDMKSFAKDLKTIYTAADEEAARKQLKTVTEKWSGQYPSAMNHAMQNPAYANKVKITNLKQIANTIIYLQKHDIDNKTSLESAYAASYMQQQKAQDQLTNLSLQLKDLNQQIHYTGQYLSNKKTYTAFFNSKNKGLYRKNHASEIQAYETARDWLKQNLSEETIPSIKKLYEKKSSLQRSLNAYKDVLSDCKSQVHELDVVRQNVDSILNHQTPEYFKTSEQVL